MKFIFLFIFFASATNIVSIKQTVETQQDCDAIATSLYEMFIPHLLARGYTIEKANKLLKEHTKCVQLSGTDPTDDGDQ